MIWYHIMISNYIRIISNDHPVFQLSTPTVCASIIDPIPLISPIYGTSESTDPLDRSFAGQRLLQPRSVGLRGGQSTADAAAVERAQHGGSETFPGLVVEPRWWVQVLMQIAGTDHTMWDCGKQKLTGHVQHGTSILFTSDVGCSPEHWMNIVWDSEKLHCGIDHVVLKALKNEILRFWEHLRTMHMCWLGWYSYKLIHILIKITDVHLHNQILFSGRQFKPFCNDNSWAFPLKRLAFNWHIWHVDLVVKLCEDPLHQRMVLVIGSIDRVDI